MFGDCSKHQQLVLVPFRLCLCLLLLLFTMPPSAEAFVVPEPSSAVQSRQLRNRRPSPTKKSLRPPPLFFQCPLTSCTGCTPSNLMICQAVSDVSSSQEGGDAASSSSSSSEPDDTLANSSSGRFAGLQQRVFNGGINKNNNKMSLKERLLKASNFASLLCVLDCTILPVITLVLPLIGIVAASPAQMEWLHELGHSLALWFVLPVGGLATSLNYSNHGKTWIAALGYMGLTAVVAANIGCHHHNVLPGVVGHWLHHVLHAVHHGIWHRVTNLAGCALLLTSNYLSHKQGGCRDPVCSHDHGHAHKQA